MSEDIIADVKDLQYRLDLYLENNRTGPVKLGELRAQLIRKFEADDKRRGVPYLAPTEQVSDEYNLLYKESVRFVEGERPFSSRFTQMGFSSGDDDGWSEDVVETHLVDVQEDEIFAGDLVEESPDVEVEYEEDFDNPEEDEDVVQESISPSDFLASHVGTPSEWVSEEEPSEDEPPSGRVSTDEEEPDEWVSTEGEEPDDWVSEDSDGFDIWQSPEEPAEEPVSETFEQASDDWVSEDSDDVASSFSSFSEPVSGDYDPAPVEPKVEKPVRRKVVRRVVRRKRVSPPAKKVQRSVEPQNIPATVEGYVKMYPGCKLEDIVKHFPKKDIEKSVRIGKVFVKNGRLSV